MKIVFFTSFPAYNLVNRTVSIKESMRHRTANVQLFDLIFLDFDQKHIFATVRMRLQCRCSHCICLIFSCSFHFLICSKYIFKELQFLIQLLDPEQQGWAAVPQAEGQLWDCQRGRSAGLSSISNQFDKVFSLGLRMVQIDQLSLYLSIRCSRSARR